MNGKRTAHSQQKWTFDKSSTSSSTDLRSEISVVRSLMLTSRFFHSEVCQIFYPSIIPTMLTIEDAVKFSLSLSWRTRDLIHTLSVPMANSTISQKHRLVDACSRMTGYQSYLHARGLQTLILTDCKISADTKSGGVKWKAYILQNIKALQKKKACPHLKHTYYRLSDNTIVMTSNEVSVAGYTKFDLKQQSDRREQISRQESIPRTPQDIYRMMDRALSGGGGRWF